MKTIIIIAALIIGMTFVLKNDPLVPGGFIIKDGQDNRIGYTKQDPLDPQRINVYDSRGGWRGYLKRDVLAPESWRYEEEIR